jgi:hypothetical protein
VARTCDCITACALCRFTDTAVVVDAATNYGMDETIVFYADKKMHARHLKMQGMFTLEDFMPAPAHVYEETTHPCAPRHATCVRVCGPALRVLPLSLCLAPALALQCATASLCVTLLGLLVATSRISSGGPSHSARGPPARHASVAASRMRCFCSSRSGLKCAHA